jgi:hypothetical protein
MEEVIAWVAEQRGLTMAADQLCFDFYRNPRGRTSCQGKIGYRGPVSPASGGWPKVKLGLTADEKLMLPLVRSEVFPSLVGPSRRRHPDQLLRLRRGLRGKAPGAGRAHAASRFL